MFIQFKIELLELLFNLDKESQPRVYIYIGGMNIERSGQIIFLEDRNIYIKFQIKPKQKYIEPDVKIDFSLMEDINKIDSFNKNYNRTTKSAQGSIYLNKFVKFKSTEGIQLTLKYPDPELIKTNKATKAVLKISDIKTDIKKIFFGNENPLSNLKKNTELINSKLFSRFQKKQRIFSRMKVRFSSLSELQYPFFYFDKNIIIESNFVLNYWDIKYSDESILLKFLHLAICICFNKWNPNEKNFSIKSEDDAFNFFENEINNKMLLDILITTASISSIHSYYNSDEIEYLDHQFKYSKTNINHMNIISRKDYKTRDTEYFEIALRTYYNERTGSIPSEDCDGLAILIALILKEIKSREFKNKYLKKINLISLNYEINLPLLGVYGAQLKDTLNPTTELGGHLACEVSSINNKIKNKYYSNIKVFCEGTGWKSSMFKSEPKLSDYYGRFLFKAEPDLLRENVLQFEDHTTISNDKKYRIEDSFYAVVIGTANVESKIKNSNVSYMVNSKTNKLGVPFVEYMLDYSSYYTIREPKLQPEEIYITKKFLSHLPPIPPLTPSKEIDSFDEISSSINSVFDEIKQLKNPIKSTRVEKKQKPPETFNYNLLYRKDVNYKINLPKIKNFILNNRHILNFDYQFFDICEECKFYLIVIQLNKFKIDIEIANLIIQ